MIIKKVFFFLFLFHFSFLFAQIDCSNNSFSKTGDSLFNFNPKKALTFFAENLKKGNLEKDFCNYFYLSEKLIYTHLHLKKTDTASIILTDLVNYVRAQKIAYKEYYLERTNLLNGFLMLRSRMFNEAVELFDEIINSNRFKNDIISSFNAHLFKAMCYQNMQDTLKTRVCIDEVINKFGNNKNIIDDFYRIYTVEAYYQRDLGNYHNAIKTILLHLNEIKEKSNVLLCNSYLLLSECYFVTKQIEKSDYYTNLGFELSESIDLKLQKSVYLHRKFHIDTFYKKHNEAYKDLIDAIEVIETNYDDRIHDLSNANIIKFGTKLKEFENENLKSQKKQLIIVIAIGVVLIISLFALFFSLKKSKKKVEIANKFSEKIISIISHDLRSPLFALQDLNNQASFFIRKKDYEQLNEMAKGIDESSIQIVNLIDNLLMWSLAQNRVVNKSNLNNLFQSVDKITSLYKQISIAKHVVIKNQIENNFNFNFNPNILELIMRNWVDNVIKHSRATEIKITSKVLNEILEIKIEDNGIIEANELTKINNIIENGSDKTNKKLGLELIHFFSKQQNYSLNLKHKTSTIFSIKINLQNN